MKIKIRHYWGDSVLFTAELDASFKTQPYRCQLGAAIKLAVKAGADLAGANLAGAYLAGADLAGADLADAYLAGANLAGADLAGAYLAGAYLAGANLAGADLAGADLADADLAGANLAGAYLAGADLADANLAGADLAGADLAGAYLVKNNKKLTLIGKRPVIWYDPIGREYRTVYAFLTDHGIYVRAGCFWDTLEKFKAAVVDTHGGNDHGTEYQAFIELAETHFKLFPAPLAQATE